MSNGIFITDTTDNKMLTSKKNAGTIQYLVLYENKN